MLPIAPDTFLQQRYRILNMLGEGRFGRTYLATDRGRADAYCAIEELAPFAQFSSAIAKAKEIFKKEAALLYQLEHPQIPRFWTTFEEQSRLLLVRDYVIGKTYRDLLNDRRSVGRTFSDTEVCQFLLELLPVIGYIHSKGTIHRDLSPEHIICRDDDRLPVPIDFGVVKEFTNKLQSSPDGSQMASGQPGYAPIEQLQHGQVYPNSDLYALAVTAIVLLTGKEPSALFDSGKIDWGWRQWTDIDDNFAAILGRMLSSQPTDRYQSAIEVQRDLQSLSIAPIPSDEKFQDDYTPLSPAAAVAAGTKSAFAAANRVQTAITNLNVRSIWEKPQVFIPVGILISLVAGVGSWFGITHLLRRPPEVEPVAIAPPPKQIDFNNPTIPIDTSKSTPTTGDTIQPEMDRPIEREGRVDTKTPIRYKIAGIAGENLDIQLVPLTIPNIDPTKAIPEIDPLSTATKPTSPKDPTAKKTSAPGATPTATQVLMTVMSPTGSPIDDKADRVVGWRGQLTTSGDYTIELRPIVGLPGAFPFKLSVTQLSVTPGTAPAVISPNPAGTAPLGIPIPIGGAGLKEIPANPNPTIPSNDLPTFSPVPIPDRVPDTLPSIAPSTTPSEPERPVRKSRRNRTAAQPTPRVRRERAESSEEAAPPRRRNRRADADAEVTPSRRKRRADADTEATPSRRNNRQPVETQRQPTPNPIAKPDLGDNGTNPSIQEERVPIVVPVPKKASPAPVKIDIDRSPPASGDIDTN